MEVIKSFDGKPENDNRPAEVEDWVTIKDPGLQAMVAKHVGQDKFTVARVEGDIAYLVARTDYKIGMYIPIKPLEMKGKYVPPAWGVNRKNLKIVFKPRLVAGE